MTTKSIPNSESMHTSMRKGPLRGVKVLDIGHMVAGPLAATLMGDLGADVVKVERPEVGDPIRKLAPHKDDISLWWKVNGRNKRSIALDLKDSKDRATLLSLAREADVVIENFVPGTIDDLGLSYDVLKGVNPRIVLLDISGFGQYGPYSGKRGFGRTGEAFGGMAYITGYADRPPMHSGFPLADCVSGVMGAFAVMSAIYERDHGGGEGQRIDLALYESPFRLMEFLAVAYDQLGQVTEREGTINSYAYPVGTWLTKDGRWASFTGSTQAMAERLFTAIGHPEFNQDERFKTNAQRVLHRAELEPILVEWISDHTWDEIVKIFDEHDVAIGPIFTIEDIFNDPHYAARENVIAVQDDELETIRMQGVVPKFSRTPGEVRHAGPPLDSDHASVIQDWLGSLD